jgi:hypothetical protein
MNFDAIYHHDALLSEYVQIVNVNLQSFVLFTDQLVIPAITTNCDRVLLSHELDLLPFTGIIIDGVRYSVSLPPVERPLYVTDDLLAELNSRWHVASPMILPKWDGTRLVSAHCMSSKRVVSFRYVGTHCSVVLPESPCVVESLNAGLRIGLDGVTPTSTYALQSLSDIDHCHFVDGLILQYQNVQYRLKFDNTYDLQCSGENLVDEDGNVVFAKPKEVDHGIVEVDSRGKFIRSRPDKAIPLSSANVKAVREALTLRDVRQQYQFGQVRYSICYHISVYVWRLYLQLHSGRECRHEMIVSFFFDEEIPYSVGEIQLEMKRCMAEARGREWAIVYDKNKYNFSLKVNRPLNVTDFLLSRVWEKCDTFPKVRKALLNMGFYFATPDLELLFRKFIRVYNSKYVFVANELFVPKILRRDPGWKWEQVRPPGELLPYHAACYDAHFFSKYQYYRIFSSSDRLIGYDTPVENYLEILENVLSMLFIEQVCISIDLVSRRTGFNADLICRALESSALFKVSQYKSCVIKLLC